MNYPQIIQETSQGISRYTLTEELLKNFEVYCTGEINENNVNNLILQLQYLNRLDENREITIYINSPGGNVAQGLALYDVMQAISNPIKTVCYGMAASMASILFMSGNNRLILSHSCVMIHDPLVNGATGGSALSIKSLSDSIMRTREVICTIMAKHCKKTIEEIYEKSAQDTYFYGQEAIEYGIADEVITSFKK